MTQPSVFRGMVDRLAPKPLPSPVSLAIEKILRLDEVARLYDRAGRSEGPDFASKVLAALNTSVLVTAADLAKVPRSGPLVVVANHPFGLIEAAALTAALCRVRPDVRILANRLLAGLPELDSHIIPIDPFGGAEANRRNRRGLREALRWLDAGGVLGVFPAGEVAHLDMRRRTIADPPWNDTAARLAQQTGASVVPVRFSGANGPLFQIAGLMHPRLRTALLPHELLNKRNREIEMRIGYACEPSPIGELRRRSEWLRLRRDRPFPRPRRRMAALGPAIPKDWLSDELASLPEENRLVASSTQEVWLARAPEIPLCLRELGRLREITFRLAGEGTGQAIDFDSFDEHYFHLLLWNRKEERIDGAYRLALTHQGTPLYTSTLFNFKPPFFDRLGPAVELGRSFIRPEAQKDYQSLLLLWRGIGRFLARHPERRRLFGPVSISPVYRPASRELMVRHLAAHHFDSRLAELITARKPYTPKPGAPWPEPRSLEDLDRLIRDIEPAGAGLPVLLRHYLKLNATLCGFSIDPAFGNCLDGLIVVDLDKAPARQIDRFLPRRAPT